MPTVVLGLVEETSSALALSILQGHVIPLGIAVESNVALVITPSVPAAQPSETPEETPFTEWTLESVVTTAHSPETAVTNAWTAEGVQDAEASQEEVSVVSSWTSDATASTTWSTS